LDLKLKVSTEKVLKPPRKPLVRRHGSLEATQLAPHVAIPFPQ